MPSEVMMDKTSIGDFLLDIYKNAVEGVGGKCSCGMTFAPGEGLVPRGMAGGNGDANDVRVVVIGQNPGRPKPRSGESERYREAWGGGFSPEGHRRLLEETLHFCEKCPRDNQAKETKYPYHDHLMHELLGQQSDRSAEHAKVLKRVYVTELLKCSFGKGKGADPCFPEEHSQAAQKCSRLWLRRELEHFPNANVVALGKDVFRALLLLPELDRREIIWVPHPNYYERVIQKGKDKKDERDAVEKRYRNAKKNIECWIEGRLTRESL